MQVAIIEKNEIKNIGEIKEFFPNVSFSSIGIEPEFLTENSLMEVVVWEMFDSTVEKLANLFCCKIFSSFV